MKGSLVGDANDTAGRTGAGVASLEGFLVATLAEIVGAGVDDDGALEGQVSCVHVSRAIHVQRTPMTLWGPISLTRLSETEPLALPWPSVSMLPRSPT